MKTPLVENALEVFALREAKVAVAEIAKRFGVSAQAVYSFLNPEKKRPPSWSLLKQVVWLRARSIAHYEVSVQLSTMAAEIERKVKK